MKRFLYLIFYSFMLICNSASADMSFTLLDSKCDALDGQWTGKGKATHWLIGTCYYQGSGVVFPPNGAGVSTVQISADRVSGSSLCPSHTSEELNAICNNGLITVKTQYGTLNGVITPTSGQAKGTLVIAGLKPEVTLDFHR